MAQSSRILENIRKICLSLPDTKETFTWGSPHFRVGEKIFAGLGDEDGKPVLGFKLEMEVAGVIIDDPRFWRAPYVGHRGWVSMDVSRVMNWDEVRALILQSYRLIAPKRSLAKLEEPSSGGVAKTMAAKPKTRPRKKK
jgi:predicted DNA-binding protein (MmcQ/YjbR family)